MGLKQWQVSRADPQVCETLGAALGLGPLAAKTLAARGYDADTAAHFLSGDEVLHDPFLMKDMDKAVLRIRAALEAEEVLAVFGDYDCDGITATVILHSYLEMIGARTYYYIPKRDAEGYGLNRAAVDELHRLGVTLIITVDNGISALDEVDYAASLGIDVIVTDHHRPRDTLPNAVALLNPHRHDCDYPFKALSGAGVAFKLVSALEGDIGYETLEHFSDLLAIGTVADVVSLTGENRLFVRHGLTHLADGTRPGVQTLLGRCGLADKRLTAESVAFALAPRINAAGRVGEPDIAVMLFSAERVGEAEAYCEQLEQFNRARKENERAVSDRISGVMDAHPEYLTRRTLTLAGEGWNSGTVGIVCSRLVEQYEKPCLLLSIEGDEARGSGRSLPGFSLIDAVESCAPMLTRYGGHLLAAGFTLPTDKVEAFAEKIEQYAAEHYPAMPVGRLRVDCEVSVAELTLANIAELERFEPFGTDCETPIFALLGAQLTRVNPTADGRHLRLGLMRDGAELSAVYFGMEPARFPFRAGDCVDIAFYTDVNTWNDRKSIGLKIKDMHLAGADTDAMIDDRGYYLGHLRGELLDEAHLPSREDAAHLYRLIRRSGEISADRGYLAAKLAPSGVSYTRAALAVDVLLELGLITCTDSERGKLLRVAPAAAKVDYANSAILRRHRQGA